MPDDDNVIESEDDLEIPDGDDSTVPSGPPEEPEPEDEEE